MALGFLVIFLVLAGLAVITSIFWIWMLVAAITRESDPNERIVWVIVIVFLHVLGALIYFFVRYRSASARRVV